MARRANKLRIDTPDGGHAAAPFIAKKYSNIAAAQRLRRITRPSR
jgi:hypothetical protein